MQRDTRQRRAIRGAILSADRPLTPQEILDGAQQDVEGLGLATVYRTINALVETDEVVAVDVPGEPPRYEPAGKDHHHHFHCRSCGRVFEVEDCPGSLKHMTPAGFTLESHHITLYGTCKECAD